MPYFCCFSPEYVILLNLKNHFKTFTGFDDEQMSIF